MKLRAYQQEAVDALLAFFAANPGCHPIVSMPTGSGKSLVLAELARLAVAWDSRVLVATHVRELVEQDHDKLVRLLPPGTVGINSAGLGQRQLDLPVTVAGIQSTFRRAGEMPAPDLLVVDECHLVPESDRPSAMYRQLISTLLGRNPNMRVVGFTATPFRMRGGWLHSGDGCIFTHVAHSVPLVRLIEEGWLAPLTAKWTENQVDTAGLRSQAGDFQRGALEERAGEDELVARSVAEVVERGRDRRCWLVFTCGVRHAEKVHAEMRRWGIACDVLTGQTPSGARHRLISDHREGRLRALVNVNVLTTGYDNPGVDLMAVMRPTRSPVLYVQMMGRGMRTSPGKRDCLVLDFGGNVMRHGPVNAVEVPIGGAPDDEPEPAPAKRCPQCRSLIHAALRECPDCGHPFPPREVDHEERAFRGNIVERDEEVELEVSDWAFRVHHPKSGKPPCVRVDYLCGLRTLSEWLCFGHDGFAVRKAGAWWRERTLPAFDGAFAPESAGEALRRLDELARPAAIRVRLGKKHPEVLART